MKRLFTLDGRLARHSYLEEAVLLVMTAAGRPLLPIEFAVLARNHGWHMAHSTAAATLKRAMEEGVVHRNDDKSYSINPNVWKIKLMDMLS